MSEEKQLVIKAARAAKSTNQDKAKMLKFYLVGLVGTSLSFVLLLLLISFLPIQGYLKIISLIFGSFLVFDIHHSLKYYVSRNSV